MSNLDQQISLTTSTTFTVPELQEFLDRVRDIDDLPDGALVLAQFDSVTGEFSLSAGTVLEQAFSTATSAVSK